jgi:hypothetical protein
MALPDSGRVRDPGKVNDSRLHDFRRHGYPKLIGISQRRDVLFHNVQTLRCTDLPRRPLLQNPGRPIGINPHDA